VHEKECVRILYKFACEGRGKRACSGFICSGYCCLMGPPKISWNTNKPSSLPPTHVGTTTRHTQARHARTTRTHLHFLVIIPAHSNRVPGVAIIAKCLSNYSAVVKAASSPRGVCKPHFDLLAHFPRLQALGVHRRVYQHFGESMPCTHEPFSPGIHSSYPRERILSMQEKNILSTQENTFY